MYSQEEIKLVPAVVKALEKLALKQCPKCGGLKVVSCPSQLDPTGNMDTGMVTDTMLCPQCNGIGKVGYVWEPKVGDKVCRGNMILFYAGIIRAIEGKRAGKFISDAGTKYEWPISIVTPILPWETIEEILEGLGWTKFYFGLWGNDGIRATSRKMGSMMECSGVGKTRGEAVRKAVIALAKGK